MQALQAGAHAAPDREPREEKFDEAIAAFRAILVDRPELVRVRLELARAFFLKEEDTLARRHFEQVLAGDVPQAVAANIARFLRIMRARRRWEAQFGAAIAPDSNLNAASGARTIYLDFLGQRLPFTRQGDIAPESGLGLSLWGGGEHQYPLSQALRLRSGANASVRDYKGRDFDRQSLSAHLGPRRLIGARTEASLLATVDRQWTAGMPETDRFGLRLEGAHRLTPRLALNARASAARRNCRDCNLSTARSRTPRWPRAGPRCRSCASAAMPAGAGSVPVPNTSARAATAPASMPAWRCRRASRSASAPPCSARNTAAAAPAISPSTAGRAATRRTRSRSRSTTGP